MQRNAHASRLQRRGLTAWLVEEWLEKYVPNELTLDIEEARILTKSGDKQKAKQILEEILIDYPKNVDAKVALAEAVLFNNPDYANELVLKIFVRFDLCP